MLFSPDRLVNKPVLVCLIVVSLRNISASNRFVQTSFHLPLPTFFFVILKEVNVHLTAEVEKKSGGGEE